MMPTDIGSSALLSIGCEARALGIPLPGALRASRSASPAEMTTLTFVAPNGILSPGLATVCCAFDDQVRVDVLEEVIRAPAPGCTFGPWSKNA